MRSIKEYIPYYKRNLKVAFPVMLTQLGASLVGLIDSVMVGHYATADLAAVSFSNAIFFTVMVFSMGALMGLTPLIGVEIGAEGTAGTSAKAEHQARVAYLFRSGAVFTLLLGVAMLVLLGGCIPLLDHFGQEPAVVAAARPYYTLIVLSIVPFLFFCLQKQFLEGLGNTVVALLITMGMNLLNIVLNWVFIFGKLGCPAMGATGAGIATLVSRALMPVLFWIVIRCHKEWRKYTGSKLKSADGIRQLWKIGAPIGCQTLLETILFTLSFVMVGWISKEALAAHQIANQIADLTFMLALGIGSATTIRVSHQLGKGDLHAVRMAANASIHLVLLMNSLGAALMIGLRHYIPMLFTEDRAVIDIASTLVMIAGFFQYADGLQAVGAAMLRGITDVRRPMVYAFIAYVVISLPLGIVLMFPCGMGAAGMWVSFIVGLSTAAILFHIRFRKKLSVLSARG